MSLVFSVISLVILASGAKDCNGANLHFAMFLVFIIYFGIFIILLIQFIGHGDCLKAISKALFGFYLLIVTTMFFVQMFLF